MKMSDDHNVVDAIEVYVHTHTFLISILLNKYTHRMTIQVFCIVGLTKVPLHNYAHLLKSSYKLVVTFIHLHIYCI